MVVLRAIQAESAKDAPFTTSREFVVVQKELLGNDLRVLDWGLHTIVRTWFNGGRACGLTVSAQAPREGWSVLQVRRNEQTTDLHDRVRARDIGHERLRDVGGDAIFLDVHRAAQQDVWDVLLRGGRTLMNGRGAAEWADEFLTFEAGMNGCS